MKRSGDGKRGQCLTDPLRRLHDAVLDAEDHEPVRDPVGVERAAVEGGRHRGGGERVEVDVLVQRPGDAAPDQRTEDGK